MTSVAARRVAAFLRLALLVFGGMLAAWWAFVRLQGDSEVVFAADELSGVSEEDGLVRGEIVLVNRGRQMAAVRRVEGRVLEDPAAPVRVTRKGSRPPEDGFWVSNLLTPGESCVAEVEVELESPAQSPITLELDVHEIGRRPLVHRRARFALVRAGARSAS